MIVCAAVKWTNPYTGLEMTIGCIRHADGLAQLNTLRTLGQLSLRTMSNKDS